MFSLVPDYDDSSDDLSNDEEDVTSSTGEEKLDDSGNDIKKLPTPGFLNTESNNSLPVSSVFTNPFREEEISKEAILEKHVKMVNTRENTNVINGKKICWNYRKGKCRFSHNCKYAHDSDLEKTKQFLNVESKKQLDITQCHSFDSQPAIDEKKYQSNPKKRRPGLTKGLVPNKKVMKMYMDQKHTK